MVEKQKCLETDQSSSSTSMCQQHLEAIQNTQQTMFHKTKMKSFSNLTTAPLVSVFLFHCVDCHQVKNTSDTIIAMQCFLLVHKLGR